MSHVTACFLGPREDSYFGFSSEKTLHVIDDAGPNTNVLAVALVLHKSIRTQNIDQTFLPTNAPQIVQLAPHIYAVKIRNIPDRRFCRFLHTPQQTRSQKTCLLTNQHVGIQSIYGYLFCLFIYRLLPVSSEDFT